MEQVTDTTATDRVSEQVAEKAKDAASAVSDKASELREATSSRLSDQVEQRSNQAGAQARLVAEALRRSGSQLESQGSGAAAQVTSQAADRIDRLGGYLQEASGDRLLADAEEFARERPWLLAGFGVIVGLVAARFIKASSADRYSEFQASGQTQPPVPARTSYSDAQLGLAGGGRARDLAGSGRQA